MYILILLLLTTFSFGNDDNMDYYNRNDNIEENYPDNEIDYLDSPEEREDVNQLAEEPYNDDNGYENRDDQSDPYYNEPEEELQQEELYDDNYADEYPSDYN